MDNYDMRQIAQAVRNLSRDVLCSDAGEDMESDVAAAEFLQAVAYLNLAEAAFIKARVLEDAAAMQAIKDGPVRQPFDVMKAKEME